MKTFRKYEKTARIIIDGIDVKGKIFLSDKERKLLINGNCTILEKMDGANTGIYKTKGQIYLQKRGSNIDGSHPQYTFFKQWAYYNAEKIIKLPDEIVVYGELMRCVHTIYYDRLPDWFLVFDIYDLKEERYLKWEEIIKICDECGLKTVPLIYSGRTDTSHLKSLIPEKSAYGDIAEGIVVKNYRQQIRGKIVKPQFIKTLDESDHWTDYDTKLNKLASE